MSLNNKVDYMIKTEKMEEKKISIYDCFKYFSEIEKLDAENEWYCKICKKNQAAEKKIVIYNSPHILIIQLKRFKNSNKINFLVDFPITGLNMREYVINNEYEPLVYDLFAIANHSGGIDYGHYYAYAKNPFTHKWYKFDDSQITQITQKDLVSNNAYLLFYRRRGLENLINLEEIYNKIYINYKEEIIGLENNMNAINHIINYS